MRVRLLLTAAVALALVVAGAASARTDVTASPAGAAAAGTLVAAIGGEPEGFDPHRTTAYPSFQVLENVYDTLVEPGANLGMQPALATRWKVSANKLTWTFWLRKGVKFHNGRTLTAADVVYSFDRMRDKKSSVGWRFSMVKKVTARGDRVVFTLNRPAPSLLSAIGGYKGLSIVPKEIVADNSIGRKPVGTGPFRFVKYVPGDRVELEANRDYWKSGRPKLARLTFKIIPDQSVKLANLRSGEVDWIDSVPPQQVDRLKKSKDIVVRSVSGNDYWYFAANQKKEPFDDVRVRQALAYGIDRTEITRAAKFSAGTPNQTAIPRASYWHLRYAPFTPNAAKAKSLLAAAGASDLKLEIMVTSDFPETVTAAQVIASQLKKVGVTVTISSVDFGTWLDRQGKGQFDVFLLGWLGNIDPDDFYYAQHHCKGGFNFQKYCNPKVDKLLDQGRREVDEAKRKRIYAQAAKLIVREASYIYLYNPDVVHGWSPRVSGYVPRPDSAIRFRDVALRR